MNRSSDEPLYANKSYLLRTYLYFFSVVQSYPLNAKTHNWFGIGLANGSPNSISILSFYGQAPQFEMTKKDRRKKKIALVQSAIQTLLLLCFLLEERPIKGYHCQPAYFLIGQYL
jgi:hypothetical protein